MIGVGLSLTQPSAPPAEEAPTLSAVVTPSSRPWLGSAGAWETENFTCTPSNATGTPTFQWEVVDGAGAEILFDLETAAETFVYSVDVAKPVGATIRCLVTDDLGSVYSNTVSTT